MTDRKSARAVAHLIVLIGVGYGKERDKEITQFRVSATTIKRVARRERLREAFLDEVRDELFDLGWHFIWQTEIEFGIFRIAKLNGWAKLTSKRVQEYMDCDEDELAEVLHKELPPEDEDIEDPAAGL